MGDSHAKVSVTISNCRNLFPLGLGKTSNPYVKVFGSDNKQLCKTDVVEKSVNPDFNSGPHTFVVPMYSILEFKVYHHLPHEDQFLGKTTLTIFSVEKEKSKEFVLSHGGDATLEAKTKAAGGCGRLSIVYSIEAATVEEAAKANKKPEENFDDLDFLSDAPKPKKSDGLDFLSSASDVRPSVVVPTTASPLPAVAPNPPSIPTLSQVPPSQPLMMSSTMASPMGTSDIYSTAPPQLPTPTPAPQVANPYGSIGSSSMFSSQHTTQPAADPILPQASPILHTGAAPESSYYTSTPYAPPPPASAPIMTYQQQSPTPPISSIGAVVNTSESLGAPLMPPLHPNTLATSLPTSSPVVPPPAAVSGHPSSSNLHSSSSSSSDASTLSRVPSIAPAPAEQSAVNITAATNMSAPAGIQVTTHNTSVLSPPPAATSAPSATDASGLAPRQVRFDATTTKPLRHSRSPATRSTSEPRKKAAAPTSGRGASPSTQRKAAPTASTSAAASTSPATANSIVSVAPVPTAPPLHGATASNKALYGGPKSQELLRAAVDGDLAPFRAVKELDPLLAHGFMQVTDYAGRNALHLAAWYGHVDLLECLLGSGAASMLNLANMLTKNAKNNLLHTAALGGNPASVEWLMFQPACQSLPLARNTRGLTAYQCALESGNIDCAKALAVASGMRGD